MRLNTNIGNIEPVKNVLARTKAFLDDLKVKYGSEEVVLVVAHGQVTRGLYHNLVGYTDDTDWWSIEHRNTEARKYGL